MAHRRDLGRFAAEDIEHAHPVVPGGDLGQGTDPHEVAEVAYSLLEHAVSPGFCWWWGRSFRRAASIRGRRVRRAHQNRRWGTNGARGAPYADVSLRCLNHANAEPGRDFRAAAGLHPFIDAAGVVDDLAHRRIEAEDAVGHAQALAGIAEHAHAADEIRPAATDDHRKGRRAVLGEVLAQGISHGAEGLEDAGVVAFSPDHEEHVGLAQPVLEADAGHRFHLLVRRVAAEVGGDDLSSPSISITREVAPPPKVGARMVPWSLIT